ncbi:MAG: LD-carboxypeptidase [Bacteroidia bacterium]|nr:LD-carboxypeptidase [Bacteroidia bacterium]
MLSVLPALSFPSLEEKKKNVFPELKTGDTVAIVSPAGAVFDPAAVSEFKAILEGLSFRVVTGKTTALRTGYFAGNDAERSKDLMDAFANPGVRGIFCAKGGWGSARLLPLLDLEVIRKNPKVLIGFSDITFLLNAITEKCGMVTFHGPVGNSAWNTFSVASFRRCVLERKEQIVSFNGDTRILKNGTAEGVLWGGNLSVLCSMLGTPWMPDLSGAILLLEETTEEPYRIDRMLTHLDQAGIFARVNGIVFGKCTKCLAEEPDKAYTTEEVFQMHFSGLSIPVVSGLPFGHTVDKLTLPIGCKASLSTETGNFLLSTTPF